MHHSAVLGERGVMDIYEQVTTKSCNHCKKRNDAIFIRKTWKAKH